MIKERSIFSARTLLILILAFMAESAFSLEGTFTVNKSYDDGSATPVTVALSCTGDNGSFGGAGNPQQVDPNNPAVFTFFYTGGDPTCTATETNVPYGYTANNADCQDGDDLGGSCTIVNTLNTDTFTVFKTYPDNNNTAVMVKLTCSEGNITENPLSTDPSLNLPAVFEVTGFGETPTCTAEELTVTPGYSVNNADCQDDDDLGDSCTLVNTLNIGIFTVSKIFNDGNETPVMVKASCSGGGTFDENPLYVDPNNPAEFTYSGFTLPAICTALESSLPDGYAAGNSDCQNGDALTGDPLEGSCTIDNTLLVHLDNNDRLGDAGIFQYYTANGNWQTFIRIINTSEDGVSVKLRFREAANSREVLDFIVFLSAFDEWIGWTDPNATGPGGGPGIRTNDHSCLFPDFGNAVGQGWQPVPGKPGVRGIDFKDFAFTGDYADGNTNIDDRLGEGHIEIIGIARHEASDGFTRDISHGGDGYPRDCLGASNSWLAGSSGAEGEGLGNVLALNGYLINVGQGQGAGFDPDILADFISDTGIDGSLWAAQSLTATDPDLDSASPGRFISQGAIKQKGRSFDTPVQGGIDAVSYVFQRSSVINEWAASENLDPRAVVTEYYNQWILTFPTKHYYVDLQTDMSLGDDISPTLADPGTDNDALWPFYEEFDHDEAAEGFVAGMSCEPYRMRMWNREERFSGFASPAKDFPAKLCYETNVLVFNEDFESVGLESNFATTIPAAHLPTEIDTITASERGWASMDFYNSDGGTGIIPASIEFRRAVWDRAGLPVTGFVFSVFNTNDSTTNHTSANAHRYTREIINSGPPEIISDGGGDDAIVYVVENTTDVTDVESIDFQDMEGSGLTYALTGGADVAKFDLDLDFGFLTFLVAPDFDAPTDVGSDNIYDVQVTVTDSGPGALLTDVQDIAVHVTDVNEYPVITSNGGGPTTAVNVGEGTRQVTFVEATDPDVPVQNLTFSIIGGLDADKFEFAAPTTGPAPALAELKFNFDTDFDIPSDSNGDNVYVVLVKVTDDGIPFLSDTQEITVTVVNSNENPVITSPDTASFAENTAVATAVMTVTATDPDVPGQALTFLIIGGADAAKFEFLSPSGAIPWSADLHFKAPSPNFEIPTDADGDNVYHVQVLVKDNGTPILNAIQDIAITVTDVNETPVITSAGSASTPENSTAVIIKVKATDVDADCGAPDADCTGVQTLAFSIDNWKDGSKFKLVQPTAASPWSAKLKFINAPDFENPDDVGGANGDNIYKVRVTVTDVGAPGPAPLSVTQAITVTVTDVNETPVITSAGTASVPENSISVFHTVTATDVDADCGAADDDCTGVQTLAFSVLPGKDGGKFMFQPPADTASPWAQGLRFITAPNFENPGDLDNNNIYEVDVLVTDVGAPGPVPLTATQTITVTVTDVNEMPVITSDGGGGYSPPGGPASASLVVREGTTLVTTVAATDDDADCGGQPATDSCTGLQTLVFSILGGPDAALFEFQAPPDDASPWSQQLQFIAPPDFENPQDTAQGAPNFNTYFLVVAVTDLGNPQTDGLQDLQLLRVEVIDQNDFAPHIVAPVKDSSSPDIANLWVSQGSTAVTTVHAIDIDTPNQTLTYHLANGGVGGPDGSLFTINSTTGELRFNAAPVFGSTADDSGDGIYEVYVIARDNNVPASHDSEPLVIFVSVVENHAPVITSNGGGATAVIAVDTGDTAVTTVTATDADVPPQTLTFSIAGGVDAGLFSITAGGVLTFAAPAVAGTYVVEVAVTDDGSTTAPLSPTDISDTQVITVTVTDPP